jgi:Holliday junction resolvasome RuvABC endonuclease subunit
MHTVIGIDPSSKKLAIVVTRTFDKKEVPQVFKHKLSDDINAATGEAYSHIIDLMRIVYCGCPVSVYLESPMMGVNPHSTIVQTQVGGAVMAAFWNERVDVCLVNNKEWKKVMCENGNIKKELIPAVLERIWFPAYTQAQGDGDLIDAAMINRFGVQSQRTIYKLLGRKPKDAEENNQSHKPPQAVFIAAKV